MDYMLTFKSYLIEAKFSEDNFSRLLSAFERRMPKLLGATLYRNGGPDGSEKVAGSTGYLYFFKNRAFRVRAKGGHVLGIDVWTEYHSNKGPSFFIDVQDLDSETIIGAMGKLARLIKNPSVGEEPITEELLEMARHIDPATFHGMAEKMFGAESAKSLTLDQVKQIADTNDVSIPGYVRKQKVGRGRFSTVPGGGDGGGKSDDTEPADDGPKKKEPILYIKITAQDPDSKKFMSAGNSKEAQQLYSQIQSSLNGKPTEAEIKDPETMYGHMAQLIEMAAKGKLRSLLVYGGPGTGKTHTIMQVIKEQGLVSGKDYVKLSGKATPIAIYETLFMFREGGLVVFDDLDSMWGNADATNILKAALDTSPVREISWSSANTINVSKMSDEKRKALFRQIDAQIHGGDAPEEDFDSEDDEDDKKKKPKKTEKVKFPSTFDFTGRVIFISNLKKDEFDPAIMSRSAKIGMDMTPEQILMRMRKILPTLGGEDVPIDKKEELIDALLKMHKAKEITQVTMREFTKGLDILRSGAPNWQELLIYA